MPKTTTYKKANGFENYNQRDIIMKIVNKGIPRKPQKKKLKENLKSAIEGNSKKNEV